ncbi:MAG: SpoIIE family protein phosphatase [Bacteroidetes bacterium]|nr:SpoIIE family protein phosphatase [Bacteroidota bacterium]
MKTPLFITISFLITFCGTLFSQQLRFKHITSEDGLSTNYITAILQDDKGFMWFGTQDGLNKYDGFQVKVFKNDPTNPNSPTSSEITCMHQLKPDLMIIGTLAGINFFNPVTQTFSQLKLKGLQVKINCISPYTENTILVGTEDGLFILDINTKTTKAISLPEVNINVTSILVHAGVGYIGTTEKSLWLYRDGKFERAGIQKLDFTGFALGELDVITKIKEYGGKLYVGTLDGIFMMDKSTFEVYRKISFGEKNCDHIKDIEIKDNKMFCATNCGFIVYKLITDESMFFIKGEDDYSLNSISATCAFIDSEKNIWVGTNLGGVNVSFAQSLKFSNSNFHYETDFNNIYSFYEEKNGNVWLGGVKHLNVLNIGTGHKADYSKLLEANTALCITQESENIFWIGTWGEGIIRFDRSTGKSTKHLSKELGGTVLCLKIHGNSLYAGTVGDGLFKIDLNTFHTKQFTEKDGLPNPSINTIFEDTKKNVWIGTYDGGLVKMKTYEEGGKLPILDKYKNEGRGGQIASNIILGINEDKNGHIWVATSNGLSKLLKDNTFYNFYEKDGLANSYLYSILKDSLNNFWMSSNGGVIRFNPLQPENEITFKNYGIKDGLTNKEYNMGAALSSKKGTMYFGGARGFNVFRPTSIKDNLHPPPTYIINYKRGGNDIITDSVITFKKHLNLSWRENYFQFEVVALDYTDPTKNKFRYKLEGYDNDWSAPTNVRYISYTALPGGEYIFKVKGANNDGTWNETPCEIQITVVPPFWKTKWFYVLVFVFALGGIYGFTQYRTKAIKKENKILENKVAERTKELEEKNRDITSSIEYAKRIQEAILPSKDHIFSRFEKAFILYKPKDIVSGDFYWFGEKEGNKIFAVVDCTGHGVPGAFMSMIGHNLLHQIIQEKGIVDPGEILNTLHKGVQEALRQGQNEVNTNDGMDVSIVAINEGKGEIKWAGANRPLVLISLEGNMVKYDGNKYPVGGAQIDVKRIFTTHTIKKGAPTMAYMFTDGYADQFGGDKGKKFMVKRFNEVLLNIYLHDTLEQKQALERHLENWRQNHEQVDDVLVVGIAI